MTVENDPSSRMQLRSMGELQSPASCYVCGNGTCEAGYLDFGTFVDYHGNFYLCLLCATQAAETIGFQSPDSTRMLIEGMESKLSELAETQEELADARKHVDAVNTLLNSRFSPTGSNGDLGKASYEPYQGRKGGESESEKSTPFSRLPDSSRAKSRHITIIGDGE